MIPTETSVPDMICSDLSADFSSQLRRRPFLSDTNMIARMLVKRDVSLVVLVSLVSFAQLGCTNSDSKSDPGQGAYIASGGLPDAEPPQAGVSLADAAQPANMIPRQDTWRDPRDQTASVTPAEATDPPPGDVPTLFSIAEDDPPPAVQAPLPQLPDDLPPAKLIEVLDDTDTDMQRIVKGQSGIRDPQQARNALIHFMKLKLEASRQLMKHPEADAKSKSEGARGELQALSHLAAVGDLNAADELEELASANLKSDDARLAADSRLVLMGFAIESLRNGEADAADRIISYVDAMNNSEVKPDVPAMMVLGQARETLANYGHEDEARRVRDTIIELFASSPDPQIAQLAGQLAGNVRFDAIDHTARPSNRW